MTDLSPRQREILTLVAAGRTSKEIAGDLGISESTVNWHISNVFGRLGASSRAEAVALAMREEIQRPDQGDANGEPHERGAARPPLPLSSVALAVAVTLVLGLFGGALLAGWHFPSSITPPASVAPSTGAPHSADLTARPTGVLAPAPEVGATSTVRPSGAPASGVPATSTALPFGAPALDTVVPVLPAVSPTTVALPLPTTPALPTLPQLPTGLGVPIGR
jgi:DNA-binding CsgD family transcriptional regulator